MTITTIRKLLELALKKNGEAWNEVVHLTFADNPWSEQAVVHTLDWRLRSGLTGCLDREFYQEQGGTSQLFFTAWTRRRVYFPAEHDGRTWVESVPRDPCGEATGPVGGAS